MSSTTYITSIPVFHGVQGKYYMVDGCKYHVRFPIEWALDHKKFITGKRKEFNEGTGPKDCANCYHYGCIRGVFVGYCGTCTERYEEIQQCRGAGLGGFSIDMLTDETLWEMSPYLTGVKLSEIGDEEKTQDDVQEVV